MKEFVSDWTHGEDWKTWIAHTVLAIIIGVLVTCIVMLFSLIFDFITFDIAVLIGACVAIGFYLLRECDQILYDWIGKKSIRAKGFDHFMDVFVPAVVIIPLALVVSLIA